MTEPRIQCEKNTQSHSETQNHGSVKECQDRIIFQNYRGTLICPKRGLPRVEKFVVTKDSPTRFITKLETVGTGSGSRFVFLITKR